MPNYWKTFHSGSCTVHRTEIEHLGGGNRIRLRSGDEVTTDCLLLCTGFDKSYQPFSPELQRQCDLAPDPEPHEAARWAKLDVAAEKTVDEVFPVLRKPPQSLLPAAFDSSSRYGRVGQTKDKDDSRTLLHHGPNRHYRRLISPSLASQGDRSVIFPGFIHSIYTPLVSEVQALWGVAFLLDMLELPNRGAMEDEVALWNAWSRKRYPTQGRKHAYSIYDFLSVSCFFFYICIYIYIFILLFWKTKYIPIIMVEEEIQSSKLEAPSHPTPPRKNENAGRSQRLIPDTQ